MQRMDTAMVDDRLTHGVSIENAELEGIDWRERRYEDVRFVACNFIDARFTSIGLPGGRFTDCRFVRCRFSHADLHEAVFKHCMLVDRAEEVKGCSFAFSDLDTDGSQDRPETVSAPRHDGEPLPRTQSWS